MTIARGRAIFAYPCTGRRLSHSPQWRHERNRRCAASIRHDEAVERFAGVQSLAAIADGSTLQIQRGPDDEYFKKVITMTNQVDGGYYAIKGFMYQFDRTLIEMLSRPDATVQFERNQDIEYEDYVLQIKHKETQKFSPVKVRNAVTQLLALHAAQPTLKLGLYCHFKDRTPGDWILNLPELDKILGKGAKRISETIRRTFLKSFLIRFSEDFESQFKNLLALIKSELNIHTDEEAIIFHSIFRSHLLSLSVEPAGKRQCSGAELRSLKEDSQELVFFSAYSDYLGDMKYEAMVRKRFFTFRQPNIENFERLFLIEPEAKVTRETLVECATRVARKYFRRGKSPQPYVCFRGVPYDLLNGTKSMLADQKSGFFDGTHFDGDRFRPEELILKTLHRPEIALKIVPESAVYDIASRVDFAEVYQIFARNPLKIDTRGRRVSIAISDLAQAARILK